MKKLLILLFIFSGIFQAFPKSRQTIQENTIQNDRNKDLLLASYTGQLDTVEKLINEGADVNAKRDETVTAFYLAYWNGHRKTAQFLKDNPAHHLTISERFFLWMDGVLD